MHDTLVILALIASLGSPQWVEREEATVKLQAILPVAAPFISSSRNDADLETATRCKMLYRLHLHKTAKGKAEKTLPQWYLVTPWIDMLPADYPNKSAVEKFYLETAREKIGANKGYPDWPEHRIATLLLLEDSYLLEEDPADLQDLVDQMAANEFKWLLKVGKDFLPPIKVQWARMAFP